LGGTASKVFDVVGGHETMVAQRAVSRCAGNAGSVYAWGKQKTINHEGH